jgi:hypothetical protein
MKTAWVVIVSAFALAMGFFFNIGWAASPTSATPERLVVHEWGTFTSFSGADGVPVPFTPNYTDLPRFVYDASSYHEELTKGGYMQLGGTVSMETPVIYFYADKEMKAAVKVDFPKGWITEWYPAASLQGVANSRRGRQRLPDAMGESIRWDVRLLPNQSVVFPGEKDENHYYQARETDSVPVEVQTRLPKGEGDDVVRGGTILQREKFLFYRGVGTFTPPVTVQALGGGKVRIKNGTGGTVASLVLVSVHEGKVGFRKLDSMGKGAEAQATLPEANGSPSDLAALMAKELSATGLYEKEAQAMVKTWEKAWFSEEGTRLLSIVPRSRTDELLPLAIEPKPTEMVRALVGRHDFLTPEQEAAADRLVKRQRAAQAELDAAQAEIQKIGRFAPQARTMAEKRLEPAQARR